jgi:hypothetical protein
VHFAAGVGVGFENGNLISFFTQPDSRGKAGNPRPYNTCSAHGLLLLEVFEGDEKHSKTLSILLSEVLVMDFMGAPDAPGVPVVRISEELEPLVDKNIVNHKIGDPVGQDTEAYWVALPERGIGRHHDKGHAHHGIKNKKGVIPLEPGIVVFAMVVPVEGPQEAVHDILMRKPRHKFHKTEGSDKQCDPVQCLHNLYQI